MELIRLENEQIVVEINDVGAELWRIFSKQYQKDILWNGDARYWGRRSPILFPIVGKLKEDETFIENDSYHMSQHGFARDLKFCVIYKDENSVIYSLKSDTVTKGKFPYEFELIVKYTLNVTSVNIDWRVINRDNKTMYFSIGGHPGFNVPYYGEDSIQDYYIDFEAAGTVEEYALHPPFIDGKKIVDKPSRLTIIPELFSNDALVYGHIDKVIIASDTRSMKIIIDCKGFPYVGIWSPYYEGKNTIAPFICVEPWYGLADPTDSNKVFKQKPGIKKLGLSEIFDAGYRIELI